MMRRDSAWVVYLQLGVGMLTGFAGMLFFMNLLQTTPTQNVVVVAQFSEEAHLEAERNAITMALQNAGLQVVLQKKQKDLQTSEQILEKMMSYQPRAVVCITASCAQSLFEACQRNSLPFVYTAVDDPVSEHLDKADGVCDAIPGDSPWKMIRHCQKNISSVGMMYDASKASSVKLAKIMMTTAVQNHINLEIVPVYAAADIPQSVEVMLSKGVQAIYLPKGELLASAVALIVSMVHDKNIPVYASEETAVKNGATAAYAHNREELGKRAALLLLHLMGKSKKSPHDEMPDLQLYVHPDAKKLFPQLDFSPINGPLHAVNKTGA